MSEIIDPSVPHEKYVAQLYSACVAASRLLLFPESVINSVIYWVSQYNNYVVAVKEEDIFIDFIQGILNKKPSLRISASEGIAHPRCHTLTYVTLIQFIGTPLHTIPMQYFISVQHDATLLKALGHLIHPKEKCFVQRNASGLGGELSLAGFRYDYILEMFYEPSFIIITAYMIHLGALLNLTEGRDVMDWLPRHTYSLRAIHEERLIEATCLSDQKRLEEMRHDIRLLREALNCTNLDTAMHHCMALWQRKAEYCYREMSLRTKHILGIQ